MESKEEINEHSSTTESAAEDAETVAASVSVAVDKPESQVKPTELYCSQIVKWLSKINVTWRIKATHLVWCYIRTVSYTHLTLPTKRIV